MTGKRRYKTDSIIRKLSKLIKTKDILYKIKPNNISGREYASGAIGGKRYNVISEVATFDKDSEVAALLKSYSPSELKAYDITENNDESWNVPISTYYGHNLNWANVNTSYDKRITGASEAAKRLSTRQAREATKQLQNK